MARFSQKAALQAIDARNEPFRADWERERGVQKEALKARIDPNSADQRLARAAQQQADVQRTIEMLRDLPQNSLRAARIKIAFNRLGELLAEQGYYEEAITQTEDPDLRQKYRDIIKALEQPDDKVCECPPQRAFSRAENREVSLSPRFVVKNVYSRPHGRMVTITACAVCGFKNAT